MDTSVMLHHLAFARLVVIELAIFKAELDALRNFAVLTEDFLEKQVEQLTLDPSVPKYLQPGDEEFEAYSSWYQTKDDLQATFLEILRSSLLVSAYAMLENLMAKICRGIGELKGHSVALEDLHGKGIERARLYLQKVAQLEFPESQEWSQILRLGRLRNKVVHAGRTIGADVNLRTDLNQVPGVSVDAEGAIRLDSAFIPSVVGSLREFRLGLSRHWSLLEEQLRRASSGRLPPHAEAPQRYAE